MGTVQEAAARMNRYAAEMLARNLNAMPPDKQTWSPLDKGRAALSQVQECAVINLFFATILRDMAVPEMSWTEYEAECAALDTQEKAVAALAGSVETLVSAIEGFSSERLAESVTLPFGGGMPMTFEEVMFAGYWNMVYHQGQVAFIQTLYGDSEMH